MTPSSFKQKWLAGPNGQICYFFSHEFAGQPTVVFLHGLSANHTTWDSLAASFQKLGLNCLMPDLRGHGHSDKSKRRDLYRLPVFTQDLQDIITKENLSKIILVGYSFGGYIALDFIIKYPGSVMALALISAGHVNPLKYMGLDLLTWPAYGVLRSLAWLLLWQKRKHYYYFDQAEAKSYSQSTFSGFTTMPLSVNFWMLSQIAHFDLSQKISAITQPTLIIKSQNDPFLSLAEARDMAQKIKSAKIAVLESNTHFLASRHQEKILETLTDFLKQIKILP